MGCGELNTGLAPAVEMPSDEEDVGGNCKHQYKYKGGRSTGIGRGLFVELKPQNVVSIYLMWV